MLWVLGGALSLQLGHAQVKKRSTKASSSKPSVAVTHTAALSLANMDKTVRPNDDFYRFVNGTWLKNAVIPSDKTRWGSFDELRQQTDKDMLEIVKEALRKPAQYANTDQERALYLFQSIIDTVSRNKQGIAPIRPIYKEVASATSMAQLALWIQKQAPTGGFGFFSMDIGPDEMNSNKNSISISPNRLGLPDRDYYVAEDKDSRDKKALYTQHVARMFGFFETDAKRCEQLAERVVAFETELAQPRLTRAERRDSKLQYNPMSFDEVLQRWGQFDWKAYFTALKISKFDTLVITQPRFMDQMHRSLQEDRLEDWKAYLQWSVINRYAGMLSTDIEKANFDFYGKTMTGVAKQRPREERALQTVNSWMGEALGQLYVEKKFPKEAKANAQELIQYLILAYENRIKQLPWMTSETKLRAIDKLKSLTIKVGYPDKWKDYTKYACKPTGYFENYLRIAQAGFNEDVEKLNKPVDKTEWHMSPQTVNAYYNPSYNEIVFPAAILQPPFYNYKADTAVNFGGIGAVIGHEISHGFDDSGAQYDAQGNLKDWWTQSDAEQFAALGKKLVDQYSALEPLPGAHVDGKFTLGENIGDLGGINAAYDALMLYLEKKGQTGKIDGFTPQQRLFISWATVWRGKIRDEALRNQLKTDPHSPAQYRGYVPLRNLESFHQAFGIKPGDKMYLEPAARVVIW